MYTNSFSKFIPLISNTNTGAQVFLLFFVSPSHRQWGKVYLILKVTPRLLSFPFSGGMCVCACVRVCVRVCACVLVCVCVRVSVVVGGWKNKKELTLSHLETSVMKCRSTM